MARLDDKHWSALTCLLVVTDRRLLVKRLAGRDATSFTGWEGRPALELLSGLGDADWAAHAFKEALRGQSAGKETHLRGMPVLVRIAPVQRLEAGPFQGVVCLVAPRALEPSGQEAHYYQTLLQHGLVNVTVLAADGTFTYSSPAIRALLGYAPEQIIGTRLQDLVHPDDIHAVEDVLVQVVTLPGQRLVTVTRVRHQDGSYRTLETSTVSLLDDPNVRGVVMSSRDVTESMEAWRALEHSELFYRGLLEHAFDLIEVVDEQGTRQYVSPAVTQMLGYDENTFLGEPVTHAVHPDDVVVLQSALARAAAKPRHSVPLQIRTVHKNGSVRLVSGVIRNFLQDSRLRGLVLNLRDITEEDAERSRRLHVERSYQALATASPYAVYQVGPDGRVNAMNEAGVSIFMKAPQDELVGTLFRDLAAPEDSMRLAALVDRCLDGLPAEFEFTSSGDRLVRASLIPVRGADGTVMHLAGMGQDITRARDEEKERETLAAQLRQSQKLDSIGQLAGGVAHDFNNILMVIMAHVSFLEREISDGPARQDVESIRQGAQRASELTRQLLTVSRKQPLALVSVDINQRLVELSQMLRRLLPETIELDVIEGHKLPWVDADPSQFEQVLLNLCVNARDAMPGGGRLTIESEAVLLSGQYTRIHPWARKGRYVLISVTDTGVGMTEEVRARAFEPFFTTKAQGQGTGLGLAMVWGIVQKHGGMVHCYSEPGVGTTFKVYLPALEREASVVGPKLDGLPAGGAETVLVAEDDPAVRDVVVRVLGGAGYHVVEAVNGEDAVAVAREHDIDLILMDSVMPKLSGQQAYKLIREFRPDARFLFSSGYSTEGFDREFLRREQVSVVAKPFDPDALLRHVRAALDERRSR